MYSWFFEGEENFRKGPVLTCPGAGKSFMDRKKLDRIIEGYIDDFDARKMREEGFEEKKERASEKTKMNIPSIIEQCDR